MGWLIPRQKTINHSMQAMRSSLSGYFQIWTNTKMQLLYIHDKGLGDNQPIFSRMAPNSRTLFIWDDAYFKKRNYSLKRLVFIYETLTTMPVEIVHGKTLDIVKEIAPPEPSVYAAAFSATTNPWIPLEANLLKKHYHCDNM